MLLNCGAGEDSWESLGLQGNQTSPKGNQSWIFIGRTNAKAEAPIVWPPEVKNWPTGKAPDAGKDWRQKEKQTAEDEMVDSTTDSMDMNLSKLQEIVEDREAWCAAVYGFTKSWTWHVTEQHLSKHHNVPDLNRCSRCLFVESGDTIWTKAWSWNTIQLITIQLNQHLLQKAEKDKCWPSIILTVVAKKSTFINSVFMLHLDIMLTPYSLWGKFPDN